ncbi:gp52 [Mycobacterium phage Brujita]|uniref:Uncharacterized protein n=2 Tax=Brujitavirus brujita TaxID=561996 RepID=B5U3C0_9CAUD|nr:gp52 [Mycobacterium phage Brujita]ACI06266.1 hypothetical protein BRUJITA_52 [Mycobacterium phage Brujita]ADL71234.1 hypothetical protein ISLAND3_52 [Mycobacterium phage Island3]
MTPDNASVVNNHIDALSKVRALALEWANQPTDYDECTEAEIDCGIKILATLSQHGLADRSDVVRSFGVHRFDRALAEISKRSGDAGVIGQRDETPSRRLT